MIGHRTVVVVILLAVSAFDDSPPQQERVTELIEKLKEENPDKRGDTAIELARIGQPAVPSLIRALHDKNSNVRLGAAWAIGSLQVMNKDLIAPLLQATKDDNGEIRQAALQALLRFDPSPETVAQTFLRLLNDDPDKHLRAFAARSLEQIAYEAPVTIVTLKKALRDPHEEVRRFAAEALGSIGLEAKAAGPELVTALKDPSVNVWSAAGPILARVDRHHRELAVASLIGQLKDLDEVRRFAAARALREIGRSAQAAVPALVERLSEETSVRTEAVRALGQIGPRAKAAVPALLQVIQKDDDPFKEASACAALALLQIDPHGKQIFPTVLRFLTDFVGDVKHADWMRRDGAYALATYGPKARTAIPVLRVALRDKSPTVRIAAAEAIAKIGGDVKEVIPILIRAVKEQDIQEGIGHFPATNGEAAEALGVIGPAAKEALPVLTQALIEKDYVLPGRIQVALAVVKIDSKVQIKAALAALRELTTAYGEGAEDAAEALVQVGPEAVPILVQMLKDERRGRTRAAATALAKLGSDASGAVRALRDVCHDPRPTVRRAVIDALGNIDPLSTQDLLLGALKDPAWSVREAAVQALGKPGFPRTEAILALLKMTKDKDLDVREAAVDVLKRIDPQGTK